MTPRRPKRALGETPRDVRSGAKIVQPKGSRLRGPFLVAVNHRRWELVKSYRYADAAGTIIIPKGFVTDLASVPRLFWWLIAPMELSAVAPIVHDYLYQTGGISGRYSRRASDDLFLSIMIREHVPIWRRVLAYLAVRWFASDAWKAE